MTSPTDESAVTHLPGRRHGTRACRRAVWVIRNAKSPLAQRDDALAADAA